MAQDDSDRHAARAAVDSPDGSEAGGREAIGEVLGALRLRPAGDGVFLGDPGEGHRRLFGGLIAGQSVVAAVSTVEDKALHSLHAHFLRAGSHGIDVEHQVEVVRDGRTISTRRVTSVQEGRPIFTATMSFARPGPGPEHQVEAGPVADPATMELWEDQRERTTGVRPKYVHVRAFEARLSAAEASTEPCAPDSVRSVWMRPRGPVPDDPALQAGLLTYVSDRTLLGSTLRPTGGRPNIDWGTTSLDHAMWFHRPPRFDDWVLYRQNSPVAHAGRALAQGAMYDRDGIRVVTVTQEGLFREISEPIP